jgi:hypothetical protein
LLRSLLVFSTLAAFSCCRYAFVFKSFSAISIHLQMDFQQQIQIS